LSTGKGFPIAGHIGYDGGKLEVHLMTRAQRDPSPEDLRRLPWDQLAERLGGDVLWLDEDGPEGTHVGVRVGPESQPIILFARVAEDGTYEEVLAEKQTYLEAYRRYFHVG
jgi:hypothetical protein